MVRLCVPQILAKFVQKSLQALRFGLTLDPRPACITCASTDHTVQRVVYSDPAKRQAKQIGSLYTSANTTATGKMSKVPIVIDNGTG